MTVFGAVQVKFTVFPEIDETLTEPDAMDMLVTDVIGSSKVMLHEKDDHRVLSVDIDSDDFDGATLSKVI